MAKTLKMYTILLISVWISSLPVNKSWLSLEELLCAGQFGKLEMLHALKKDA